MLAAQHLYEKDVIVSIANSYDNTEVQIQQIDSLINCGIDLLVVAPNEAAPIAKAINRAKAKGIPVIFFDRKAATEDYTAFIGGDNVEAGKTVGSYAVTLAHKAENGNRKPLILEVTATMTTSPAQERHQGFEQVMKTHPELDYMCIQGSWSTQETYHIVKNLLNTSHQPDIVFCHSDFMADGAYQAVKEARQKEHIKILGIDGRVDEGIAYIQKGRIDGSYIYPTHGEHIIRLALDILTGQPYKRDNYLPSMMVTPENADIVEMNSQELIAQSKDLITIQDKLEGYFGLYNTQRKVLVASFISILLLLFGALLTWRAAKQRKEAHAQMKRLNEEQTLFYTNASHQLKTPLTLIAGPIKKLLEGKTLNSADRSLLEIVSRNVTQLETVTSNVLNFRKHTNAVIDDKTVSEIQQQADSATVMRESRRAVMKQEDTEELPSILVVDDNNDMRLYLRTLLADKFYVIEAADGQGGLKLARDMVPDVVVSDVMMPVMNGLQFCHCIKQDTITCHIPVILLTARDTEAQQIEGYEHGADAYITKPFNADLLISRIYNLVKNRQQLRSFFKEDTKSENPDTSIQAPHPSSQDKLFAEQLKEAIRKHMSNPNLKMEELGDEIGLSRVQLYRKVKALTGLSPVELLREIRLQHGYTLLQTTTKTVNEIAYEVGFGTPGYFSTCFKKQFGKYPTDVRTE